MAGVPGFEPGECQSQSLMPYRLAIPQRWWRRTDLNCRTLRELIYSQPRLATSLLLRYLAYYRIRLYPYKKMVDAEGLEPPTLAL